MQRQNFTAMLSSSVLALCVITYPAAAQRSDRAAQEAASIAKKNIPWDEPGKPPGVPAIDEYRATGVSKPGGTQSLR